jgi:gamma-glutamyltranspeptidase/glutathione hydrolase
MKCVFLCAKKCEAPVALPLLASGKLRDKPIAEMAPGRSVPSRAMLVLRISLTVLPALFLVWALPGGAHADTLVQPGKIEPGFVQPFAKHEMVAAANPLAAEAGLEMLREGGSAVDAAIAVQMVLNLVEPESSGLGGGAFMLAFDPETGTTTSFDGRESAPASARPDMFLGPDGNPRPKLSVVPGGLSVGVPGVVAMLEMAHARYGKLPWARLFQPAIQLAENGFPVGPKLARTIARWKDMAAMPDIRRTFYHPDGTPLQQGDILKEPALAASMRAVAKGGAKAFYDGKIAQEIVDAVQHAPRNQGGMTLKDLADYRAKERPPVCGPYRRWRVCSMGPPSSGGVAIVQIMGMLQRFPSSELQPGTLSEVQLFTQASRLAYADRAKYLADSDFVKVPLKGLLDPAYIASRAALIDPHHDMGKASAGDPPERHAALSPQVSPVLHGTSHMTIVDRNGMVVSMTTSVEFVFGAEIMAGGFLLNNTLTDFSRQPVIDGKLVANAPAPGKRPLSAMSPTIVYDKGGKFLLSLGSPGGPAIIDYVAQTLVAILDGRMTPQQAIALPRQLNLNGPTRLENSPMNAALVAGLKAMGHDVMVQNGEGSGLHAIERVEGGYIGGADPRRDGVVLGD